MIKKLAIEFTNGIRRELILKANAILMIGADLEPVLLGSSDVVTVTDTTQELSAQNQTINLKTGAAASVATLADGLFLGQRIALHLKALGTGGDALVLTSGTGILASADSTPLTSLDFDAADEYAVLDWTPAGWQVVYTNATETAA